MGEGALMKQQWDKGGRTYLFCIDVLCTCGAHLRLTQLLILN